MVARLGNISYFLVSLVIISQFAGSVFGADMTAEQVMRQVDSRDTGKTSVSDMSMTLIDRRGSQRVRSIKAFRKDYGDVTKSINFFLSPADVRNTAFLAYDWKDEDKEDDNWLYLPALRKVKRISGSSKKDSFMGSDFSYSDINGLNIADWNFKFLKESDPVDGKDCWVIESVPKPDREARVIDETGYEKNISWIRKDIFMSVKGMLYVKKGRKIKYFTATDIEQNQKIWTAGKLTMITTKRKKKEHSTVLQFGNITYNEAVDDNLFTTQQMERGL